MLGFGEKKKTTEKKCVAGFKLELELFNNGQPHEIHMAIHHLSPQEIVGYLEQVKIQLLTSQSKIEEIEEGHTHAPVKENVN
jgi:hypothetical protein